MILRTRVYKSCLLEFYHSLSRFDDDDDKTFLRVQYFGGSYVNYYVYELQGCNAILAKQK